MGSIEELFNVGTDAIQEFFQAGLGSVEGVFDAIWPS